MSHKIKCVITRFISVDILSLPVFHSEIYLKPVFPVKNPYARYPVLRVNWHDKVIRYIIIDKHLRQCMIISNHVDMIKYS